MRVTSYTNRFHNTRITNFLKIKNMYRSDTLREWKKRKRKTRNYPLTLSYVIIKFIMYYLH